MNITSLLSSLIVSGCLGYLNYSILEKLGTISFHKNSQDEKRMLLLMFSALNYGMYLAVASFVKGAEEGNYNAIAFSILIVIVLDILLTPILSPIISCFKCVLDFYRYKLYDLSN